MRGAYGVLRGAKLDQVCHRVQIDRGAVADGFLARRLDGDLYESTTDGLVHLYPKLSPGGFAIVDAKLTIVRPGPARPRKRVRILGTPTVIATTLDDEHNVFG